MKEVWVAVSAALLVGAGLLIHYLWSVAAVGVAYKAKMLCSGVFVAGREPEAVLTGDLAVDDLHLLKPIFTHVDRQAGQVSASLLGVLQRHAVYRPGLGCTLLLDGAAITGVPPEPVPPANPWPGGIAPDSRLDAILDRAFSEPDTARLRRTRAVVVVHRGRLVAERYAQGFSAATPLVGWSATKSVINALAGILVGQGRLELDAPVRLPEWSGADDPRRAITLDQLLRMSSGLAFEEDYRNPLADVTRMLLLHGDAAAFAAGKPLLASPGSLWRYASGTSNIIARVFRQVMSEKEYRRFPREVLFEPLGMASAVLEPDAAGTFIGSSFLYATARDFARFGQLYLQDGVWEGQRILPEGWVAYTRTPAPADPGGQYGAHFWLKLPAAYRGEEVLLPADSFHAVGHEGQLVTIIPSRDLVVVRLGLTRKTGGWHHDRFVTELLEALGG